jgi:membrane fusion protein (multidrug efflux system)
VDRRLAEQTNANAALKLAQAQLSKAQLELGYTKVKAPINGYMGKALKEIGSYVDAGQNSLLVMMWQVDPIYVSFSMSEREYLAWRGQIERGEIVANGTPYIEVTLLNGDVYPEQGELNFESAVINELTGSVEMRATFSNANAALKPGQFVKARIVGWQRPNSIAVPKRSVSQSPQGASVFVVDAENKAQLRMITPGAWSGNQWIVEQGLAPGDKVIVEGLVKVQPGIQVVPSPWDPNAPAAPPATEPAAAAPANGAK